MCWRGFSEHFTGFFALALLAVAAPAAAETVGIEDCVRLALERVPAVQSAGYQVDAARAQVRAARAAYVPHVLLQGQYGRSAGFDTTVTDGGVTAALVTVEAPLWDGGLRDAEFAAARARLRSAAAIEQQRRADTVQNVRTAFFTALEAQREVQIQGDSVHLLRDAVRSLRRQKKLGLVPTNDVLRAQLGVDGASNARRAAAAQLDSALRELETMIGTALSAESLTAPAQLPSSAADVEGLEASPMVADARAAVDAARRQVDVVRSAGHPQVKLTASGGALGVRPEETFRDYGGGQFLLGIDVPLFDGGAVAAQTAAAVASVSSAEADLQQARRTATTALAQAGIEAGRARAELSSWQQALPKAEQNLALMRARYFGGGSVRLLEVLDALAQVVDARLAAARAQLSYRLAVGARKQILGEVTP
jgi:outer membrane protein TolC